jgi:acyl-coenzyme A synthetase/AMP-(fatty) acid ligase
MSPAAGTITPRYVRLSGEIADQPILDLLRAAYPEAAVAHAFASTEAGVVFDVNDGFAGFPANFIGRLDGGVETKVEAGSLRVRSPRNATRYLGDAMPEITEADGFVDTRDVVELQDGRYYFAGRRDGIINVGGLKVHPEEVEGVINEHPQVRMSLVTARNNPITGALVVAEVVLKSGDDTSGELQQDILRYCHQLLPRHKVPASIRFVGSLAVSQTGKLVRRHA